MLRVFSIPYSSALYLSRRMDIREIRRQNLALLRAQIGSIKDIADRVDTDANYISQLLSPRSRYFMGHNMARRLEHACAKPTGWMDQAHTDDYLEEDIEEIASLARRMDIYQRKNLKNLMHSMISPKDQVHEKRLG